MSQYVPKAALESIFSDLGMIQELPFSMFNHITYSRDPFSLTMASNLHSIAIVGEDVTIKSNMVNHIPFTAKLTHDAYGVIEADYEGIRIVVTSQGEAFEPYTHVQKEYANKIRTSISAVVERIKKRIARVDFL